MVAFRLHIRTAKYAELFDRTEYFFINYISKAIDLFFIKVQMKSRFSDINLMKLSLRNKKIVMLLLQTDRQTDQDDHITG